MRRAYIAATLLLAGCAAKPEYLVTIDAISSGEHERKSNYVLLSGNKDVPVDDLQFKEFAKYIHRALTARGFSQVGNISEAEIAIFLLYGIGDPQEHYYTYSRPIWGQTGVSSSSTTGTMNLFGNTGTYSGTTTYTPTYGITGFSSGVGSYVTYFRYITLSACDVTRYLATKKPNEVWRTSVTSTGSCGDLRSVFPILVAAAWEYIGENTGKKVQIKLHEDDPLVLELKGADESR